MVITTIILYMTKRMPEEYSHAHLNVWFPFRVHHGILGAQIQRYSTNDLVLKETNVYECIRQCTLTLFASLCASARVHYQFIMEYIATL